MLAATAAATACVRKDPPKEAFGLIRTDVRMTSENLAKLNATVWAKTPIGGEVIFGGRRLKADIAYSGKSTIDAYRKSYELFFADGETFRDHSTYRIYAAAMDTSGIRSEVGYHFFAAAGLYAPRIEPTALYLNDTYAGVYALLEPVDLDFLTSRGVAVKNLVKTQYGNAEFSAENFRNPDSGFDIKAEPEFYGDIQRLIETVQHANDDDNLAQLGQLLNIEQFLKYVAVAVLLNHWDGFRNNLFFYRTTQSPTFQVLPWDLDRLYDSSTGHGTYVAGVDLYGQGGLVAKVMSYPSLKTRYHEILKDTMTRVMPLADLEAAIDQASSRIAAAYAADPTLSVDGRTAATEASALKDAARGWYTQVQADLDRILAQ